MAVDTSAPAREAAGPAPGAAVEARPAIDAPALGVVALGHAVTDSYGWTLLAPMMPVLAARLALTEGDIGMLALVMGLSASLGQPLLGLITDRRPRWCLVALGPMIAALFVTRAYQATGFWTLAGLLFCGGIGIGAFHPQGAMLARRAGHGSGLAMSAFTVGGNLGFGLAPLLGGLYYFYLGPERFHWAATPAILFGVAMLTLYYRRGFFGGPVRQVAARHEEVNGQIGGQPWALALLTGTVVVRSAVQQGLVTFLPFLVVERMGLAGSGTARAVAVSTFLLASAFAGPLGGHLADRIGRRRLMLVSSLLAPWPVLAAMHAPGPWMLLLMGLGGLILTLPHPSNVVWAQEFMPRSAGIAASMITGFGWGIALLAMKPLGDFAHASTTHTALAWLSLTPLLGLALTLPLPETPRRSRR